MEISDIRIITLLTGHDVYTGLVIDQKSQTEQWFFVEPYFKDIFLVDENAYWEDGWNDDEWLKAHHCRIAEEGMKEAIKALLHKEGYEIRW